MADAASSFAGTKRNTVKETNPYGKAAKNETADQKAARQKKFYSFQRESAQERGDQGTVNKIYGKLGKKAPNVDSSRGDKAILATAPSLAGGANVARGLLTRAARAAAPAAAAVGSKLANVGRKVARSAERDTSRGAQSAQRALESRRALTKPAPKALPKPAAQKALPKPKPASEKAVQPKRVKAGSARAKGESPRGKGDHPRAKNENPRSKRKKAA